MKLAPLSFLLLFGAAEAQFLDSFDVNQSRLSAERSGSVIEETIYGPPLNNAQLPGGSRLIGVEFFQFQSSSPLGNSVAAQVTGGEAVCEFTLGTACYISYGSPQALINQDISALEATFDLSGEDGLELVISLATGNVDGGVVLVDADGTFAELDFDSPLSVGTLALSFADFSLDTDPEFGDGVFDFSRIAAIEVFFDGVVSGASEVRVSEFRLLGSGSEAVTINAGFNDAWFNPDTAGQGFFVTVFPDTGIVFVSWFTFETERPPEGATAILGEPGHRWITAQGPFDGSSAILNVTLTAGGVFDSSEPAVVNTVDYGTLELEFTGCNEGLVSYTFPGQSLSGQVPIQRVVTDNITLCEALQAGSSSR